MNAKEISMLLAERAESFAKTLYPDAVRRGKDLKIGNVRGEKGDSMVITLSGQHKGRWMDFATNNGGDLLDLLMAYRGCDIAEAMRQARQYLGINDVREVAASRKVYTKPQRPQVAAPSAVAVWFEQRGISAETVKAYRIGERVEAGKVYAVMPFFVDGEIVNFKWRNIAEKRDMRQAKDPQPSLFGWHLIDPRCRSVVITEGEIDAMSVHQCGIPALSIPSGAGNHQWIEVDWDRLERFSDIVLWYDNDDAGKKGAAEVAKRLGLERVRLVKSDHKDANDAIRLCGDEVIEAYTSAVSVAPDDLKSASEYVFDLVEYLSPNREAEIGAPLWVGDTLPFIKFRPCEVTVWTGINGHGKSAFLGMQAVRWAINESPVAIFSGEMHPKQTLGRMVRQVAGTRYPERAEIERIVDSIGENLWMVDVVGNVTVDRLVELFSYCTRRRGCKQFVVDSLMMTDIPEDGKGAMDAQRVAMQKLVAFAQNFGCHVHVVAHPRKTESESHIPGKLDVAGSRVITGMAHNVISVWADLKKTDLSECDGKVVLQKQRNGDVQFREVLYFYDPESMRYLVSAGFDDREAWA